MQLINELTLSKDLIKFPSITPVDAGAIKFLSKKLKLLGFNCKILEFKKRIPLCGVLGGGYNKDFNKLVELHSMLHKSCAEII